jgi:hypothetical protein
MRALTMDELEYVSGGEQVTVTASRRDALTLAAWDQYFRQQEIFAGLAGFGAIDIGLPTEDMLEFLPGGFEKYGDGSKYMRNTKTGALTLTPAYAAQIIDNQSNGYYVNWANVAVTLGIAAGGGAQAVTKGVVQQVIGVANNVLAMVGISTSTSKT